MHSHTLTQREGARERGRPRPLVARGTAQRNTERIQNESSPLSQRNQRRMDSERAQRRKIGFQRVKSKEKKLSEGKI